MRHDATAYSVYCLGFFLSENMLNKIFIINALVLLT